MDAVRRGPELRRRAIAAARSAPSATSTDDELLPGKAARLLRRRRRDLHRRRRARRGAALDPRARPGRGQVRQRAHRHERPARHHPGRGADREAQDLPRRDRGARPRRRALQRSPARGRHRARGGRGLDLGLGAVHAPHPGSRPRRVPGRAQERRHPDRDLLPEAAAPADRLQALSERRQRTAGLRAPRRRGDQPADAPLPRPRRCRTASSMRSRTRCAAKSASASRRSRGPASRRDAVRSNPRHRRCRLHRLRALRERLLELGRPVVGVDNLTSYYDVALKEARLRVLEAQPLFRFERLDLADSDAVQRLFETHRPRPGNPSRGAAGRALLARRIRAPMSTRTSSPSRTSSKRAATAASSTSPTPPRARSTA